MRTPRGQAEQVVAALKADGRIADVHIYPNESQGFVEHGNQLDALTRPVDWFGRYPKDGHGG